MSDHIFKVGEIVQLPYFIEKGDTKNFRGQIQDIRIDENGDERFWVANMNMPFQGTFSRWIFRCDIEPYEVEKV